MIKSDNIVLVYDDETGVCTVTFSPNANANGSLNIKLLLSDGITTVEAFIPVTISSENDAPLAADDNMTNTWKVFEDTPKNLDLSVLRSNDIDPEGSALTVTGVSDVSAGTLALSSGETYLYTPPANFV